MTSEAGMIVIPAEDDKVKTVPEPTTSEQICTTIGIVRTSTAANQIMGFMNSVSQQSVIKGASKSAQKIIRT
jgi:hypothetical protein